ncbi:MAG: aminomethyl-transferring glycine dehydrogenase subunit GcvPB [Anaerolineae bacterium]|nr:aminomethyl-transferring glycine dehydrogenase subunit GcvPB [Anaerolineae bacterium]
MTQPLIYELSSPGRQGTTPPEMDVPETALPEALVREELRLPEVSEIDVVRHFLKLSQLNYAIDKGMYPLGSCTMKYNPKINEVSARLAGFSDIHPFQDPATIQGALELMFKLQQALEKISGFARVSLQPAAGAQGELAGVLMMRKYHISRGETQRDTILVPDSAHGTNPASIGMSGLRVIEIPSDDQGNIDLQALRSQICDRIVGIMITNPNTLGLFEERIMDVAAIIHSCGGLVYGDGANMNALVGVMRPADAGIDVMHFNLHKTFSTPHGGGGPGSGPVGVVEKLADFLPSPLVMYEEKDKSYRFYHPPQTIGRMKAFYGHFGILVRAYTYIRMLGQDGLRKVAEHAVLNANYLRSQIQPDYPARYNRHCKHEFVVEGHFPDAPDVHALDIAKRLIDYGVHAPTNYFPLIVPEALMIEPTETESMQSLDNYANALRSIAEEARTNPQLLHDAPLTAPVRRLDEVAAARNPILRHEHPSKEPNG